MQGIKFMVQDTKPWYLCGSGCFKRREKPTQPKLKMDRKRMRKVRSSTKVATNSKARALSSQLGVLDREANQLLVDLRGGKTSDSVGPTNREITTTAPGQGSFFVTDVAPGASSYADEDDYSEEELARIFKEQTAKIENAYNASVEEPASFRRPFPGEKDQLAAVAGKQEEDVGGATGSATTGGYGAAGAGGTASTRSPSTAFLTQGAEETRGQQAIAPHSPANATMSSEPSGALLAALGSSPAGANLVGTAALAAVASGSASGTLPPIQAQGQPGSRGSSAGGVSRSDPLDMLLKDSGSRTKPMPDIGVREAMKALRAAAMSEYAVAV